MRVLGIVTARGGSKGVPRKNVRLLAGKPLIAYTAEAARQAKKLDRVILSTDDREIADTGRKYGLDVPFMRPAELALDATPTLPVLIHALEQLERTGEKYDAVCLLQPTNPLRRAEDIDNCIEMLELTGADSVVSILEIPAEYNPKWVYWLDEKGNLTLSTGEKEPVTRRQDLPAAFHRDGSVYVTRSQIILKHNSLYGRDVRGYLVDAKYSANIDTEEDWRAVEERFSLKQQATTR